MIEVTNINKQTITTDTIITIGTFDGVHIGHQKIIKTIIKKTKKNNLKSVVLTFFPHPRMVLQKDADIKLINTLKERSSILAKLGLDFLVIEEFTKAFSRLTALEFVRDVLVNKLQAKHVIIGYDHRFGRNRTANIDDLREFGDLYNFKVHEISAQDVNDVSVSSTKIRDALLQGDIKTANTYLGYTFMLSGTVVKGKGLGNTIGFPTANLHINETYKLIPKNGVYAVSSSIKGTQLFGMMNIGTNPTVNGKDQSIEVNFFNFNEDIYNEELQIEIHDRLRDEEKFDSVEALIQQLNKDKESVLHYFKTHVSQ